MAETIKSVLFVDYDSLYRSLRNSDIDAAERLAGRVGAWIAALEQGRLAPSPDSTLRRRVLIRRCYADPSLLGDRRKHFTGTGFLVVDCPPLEGRERTAADIQMALDTIDSLEHPTGYEEFILLSADSDFSPVLMRLRAHNRQAVVYATPETGASYKAIADRTVDQEPFIALLTAAEEPKVIEPIAVKAIAAPNAPAEAPAADRNEIETLARKVHAATNVPLFSPKSYLELFRVLAEEVAENGYHFQATAENVAAKLTASGRNATRRQIVFIVKGLALKGHVFSNTDTPERLAEVFREQALYLIRSAGLELTTREQAIIPAWIIGRVGSASAGIEIEPEPTAPAIPPKPKEEAPKAFSEKPAAKPEEQASRAAKKKPGKPGAFGRSEAAVIPPRPTVFGPAKAAEAAKPQAPARVTLPVRPGALSPPKPPQMLLAKAPSTNAAATAAKPPSVLGGAGSTATRPTMPPAKSIVRPPAERPPEKPPAEKTSAEKPAAGPDKDAVESTILAAIAQAVDVLVEDSSDAKAAGKKSEETASAETPPAPPANELPPPDSDDIGDEIQRIIATYNRDRQQS